jgi:hypothetical protein
VNSGEYIQWKMQAWADRNAIGRQGSKGPRGEPNYTISVEDNIFGRKIEASVRAAFGAGAGGELRGSIPPMSAMHSSAALAVNLFQYWVMNGDLSRLATILQIPTRNIVSAGFEEKFPVCAEPASRGFTTPPHLDFAIRYSSGDLVGVECKMFEPYGRLDHKVLRRAYLGLADSWRDMPACRVLADQLIARAHSYNRLGPSQLLKHILGLRYCASSKSARLIYLYYDAVGDDAAEHRAEIRRFQAQTSGDPVRFVPISAQELIARAVRLARKDHPDYVDYLTDRYL